MADGITIKRVIASGGGYTTVEDDKGRILTVKGTVAWRANNPGNLRPGKLTNDLGAVGVTKAGKNGKFLVFPDYETGVRAQEALQFNTPYYSNRTIADAISKYAPSGDNNNPAAYARQLANALGVSVNTKLSDLTPEQRKIYMQAQRGVENSTPGRIYEGNIPLPLVDVPDAPKVTRASLEMPPMPRKRPGTALDTIGPVAGRVPLPFSGPLVPPSGVNIDGLQTLPPPELDLNAPVARGNGAWWNTQDKQPGMMGRGLPTPPAPPIPRPYPIAAAGQPPPMPMRRPTALSAQAEAPMPMQRPSMPSARPSMPSAPVEQQTQQLRLASGKMIAPGNYTGKNGMTYTVSDDGTGNAVVKSNRAGAFNIGREMNAPTLAGSLIRSKIPEALSSVPQSLGYAADNLKNSAVGAAENLGNRVGDLASNLGGMFGGLFGGQPPPVPQPRLQPGMMGRGQPRAPVPMPSPRFSREALLRLAAQEQQRQQQQSGNSSATYFDRASGGWVNN